MMISNEDWKNYIEKLSSLDKTAGDLMLKWVQKNGFSDSEALTDYAYALVTKYGEGSAALAAEMYDAVAEMSGKFYPPAETAPTPDYEDVAKAVNGTRRWSQNEKAVPNTVSRMVKQTGADTTLRNAIRDQAEFAWVPNGDTCAFCITLASNGWQPASNAVAKGGHAEHIHPNCDCTFAIRFDGKGGVKGYDPEKYKRMYDEAEGGNSKEKINSIRRMKYQENKDRINAQKREAYAERTQKYKSIVTKKRVELPKVFHGAHFKSPMDDSQESFLDTVAAYATDEQITPQDIAYVRDNIHQVSKKENIGKVVTLSSMNYVYTIELMDYLDYNILWKTPNDDNLNDAIARRRARR